MSDDSLSLASSSDEEEEDEARLEAFLNARLKSTTIVSLFKQTYAPKYMDLCAEFADSEEFLVDGDAVLRQTLRKEGLLTKTNHPHLSTLHVVSLLESILANFRDRGGEFNLVFFQQNRKRWASSPILLLLRSAIILHFKTNTNISVLTKFEDPFDPNFQHFVKTEKPSFLLSAAEKNDEQDALFFLGIQNLGLNFADVFGAQKTLVSVFVWYSSNQPSRDFFIRMKLYNQWKIKQPKEPKQLLEVFKLLPSSPPWACTLPWLEHGDLQPPELRLVLASLLLSSTLQDHLPLLDRLQPGQSLTTTSAKVSKLLEQAVDLMLNHLYLANPSSIADILDTQFFLSILMRLAMNATQEKPVNSLVSLFQNEVQKVPTLQADLQFLNTKIELGSLCTKEQGEALKGEIQIVKERSSSMPSSLLRIDNPLYKSYTKDQQLYDGLEVQQKQGEARYKKFEEKYHWHTMKKLSDDYDRTKDNRKSSSFFARKNQQTNANFMMRYGTSIEGGIDSDSPLVVAKQGKKAEEKVNTSAGAIKIQRENIRKRFLDCQENLKAKYDNLGKEADESKIKDCATQVHQKYAGLLLALEKIGEVKSNKKVKKGVTEDTLDSDIKDYFDKLLRKIYLKLVKCLKSLLKQAKEDEDKNSVIVNLMTAVKKLTSMQLTEEEKAVVDKILQNVGFSALSANLGFGKQDKNDCRSFARFQLQVFAICNYNL